ncbi:hypothetical protein GCM10010517_81660 [Streptosporangium fragile]|uniref:HEPN domain-containing protein n=1 Tax=Streptosporangium fragile TaxID=46186 RepID=A0ABP6IZT3_9ACTN
MEERLVSPASISREEADLSFREARRELDWAQYRYGQAQRAIEADGESSFDLNHARQVWSWALMEWTRSLIAREEIQDRSGNPGRMGKPFAAAEKIAAPDEGKPSAEDHRLREARHEVESATAEYERVRRGDGGSSAELSRVREVWSLALTAWARALIAREEARDRVRIAAWEEPETPGAQAVPPRRAPVRVWSTVGRNRGDTRRSRPSTAA